MKTINLNRLFIALLFVLLSIGGFAAEYTVDKKSSTVNWTGKKVTGKHFGKIYFESGELNVKNNRIVGGSFIMDMTSFTVDDLDEGKWHDMLYNHLRSDDFFSVDKHKTSTLELTSVRTKDGKNYQFTGNLVIKEISHPVQFNAQVDLNRSILKAEGQIVIDRTLYGMRFNSGKFFVNLGDKLVYDEFTLDFQLVAKK